MKYSNLFLMFLIFFLIFSFSQVSNIEAGSEHNVSGLAWTGDKDEKTIGWISFNSLNCDPNGDGDPNDDGPAECVDPIRDYSINPIPSYGINIDSSGNFSINNYAYYDVNDPNTGIEENGWIDFAPSGPYPNCPVTTCPFNPSYPACVDLPGVTGEACDAAGDYTVTGWAKAFSSDGSWDGWILLGPINKDSIDYGVWIDNNLDPPEFRGYAWGDTIIGWISFNDEDYDGSFGPFDYQVITDPAIFNSSPSAINLDIDDFENTVCGFTSGALVRLQWEFNDDPGDTQSAYRVEIATDSGFSDIIIRSCDPSARCLTSNTDFVNDSPTYPLLDWGTPYYWQVKVWDQDDAESVWTEGSFTTPTYSYPYLNFIPIPQNPAAEDPVEFFQDGTDSDVTEALCYVGGEHLCQDDINTLYDWDFSYVAGDGFITESTYKGNATTTYATSGEYKIRLQITDNNFTPSVSCTEEKTINATLPLPEWKEISPFGLFNNFLAMISESFSPLFR